MEREALTICFPPDLLAKARKLKEGSESFNDLIVKALEREMRHRQRWAADRKARAENSLPQVTQADAFRVKLTNTLRPLTDANEIQTIAARILGESLGASRVIYIEVLPGSKEVIVHKNYTNGVAELSGLYHLEDFGRNLTDDHRAGRTAIVPNVANYPKYTASEKARYRSIDIAAHIDVPLIKNDRFVALLAVHQANPRQWTEDEVKQVEETAEQTWAAVERARAEAALRESRTELEGQLRKFNAIVAAIPDFIYTFDLAGRFTYVSPALLNLWQKTSDEALGKNFFELDYPTDLATRHQQQIEQTIATRQPLKDESSYTSAIGTRAYEYIFVPLLGINGAVEAVAGVTRDITDRKLSEELSRRTAEFNAFRVSLADALRPLADPVEIQATASRVLGEYLGANRVAYFEVRGADYVVERDYVYKAAALAGNYSIDSFGPKLLAAYRTGRAVFASDVQADPNLSADQRSAYAAIEIGAYIGIPLVKEGEFVAGLAVHTSGSRAWTPNEVSLAEEVAERTWAAVERARTEAALRDSENRFRMAIESAQLGTWDWNLIANQLIWDEGCKAMFGLPPEAESSIEVFFAGLHPDDRERLEQVVQWTLNPKSSGKYDVEYRTIGIQDRVERWIAARGQAYFDAADNPQRFVGTVLNITEQKRIEAEREQLLVREQAAREAADRANRIKDEFLAVLSHELRSPLNPILGWTQLLQNGKLSEAQRAEALKIIERNANLQTRLIEDLLDISRIMQGKLSLTAAPVSLTFVIYAAVETVRLAAEAKNIAIALDLDSEIAPISGDAARLQQVMWNLLTNAVKFTLNSGQVTIELRQLDGLAQIQVIDTGKGINPQFLPHVFEYFWQEDGSTTRKFGGLGLGLAIVRQIVEMHGGRITAESQGENQGATFIIQLPLMQQSRAKLNASEPIPTQREAKVPLDGVQILLVDDEADTREFQAFVLSQSGANVTAVASALEALQALKHFTPDVLVSDIGMAEMDGYMLMQQIRSRPPNQGGTIRAIALTAYAGEIDQQRAFQVGFQTHITKPVEPEKLVKAIVSLVS
ncbi:YlcI/YnfO family protein [Nostoc sp.]|uniref:YlcI/YnfO family protein n=1 Tax=Nostoc sp. TaxID=1180 RepID=UPI002FFAD712